MQMKWGNITNPAIEITQEIKSVLDNGFDFVEIGIEWPEGSPEILEKKKKNILDLTSQFDSSAIGHTAWWMDFSSLYELERLVWIAEGKKCVDVAHKLGIELLNFHSFSMHMQLPTKYRNQALDNFVASLREIIKHAENSGVQIMIENTPNPNELSSLKDYSYIMKKLPQARVHLDVAHAFIKGGMKSVESFIKTFDKRIAHLHFSDNHGKFDEHLPIGRGNINYEAVVKMLKKIKYNKTATFEVFPSRKEAVTSMKKIKEMWR